MKDNIHYYSNYASSHDIDCFFKIGDVAYHFASNGKPIPDFITMERNIRIQEKVYSILADPPEGFNEREYDVNENEVNFLLTYDLSMVSQTDLLEDKNLFEKVKTKLKEDYLHSFIEMARLGFVSMDLIDEYGHFVVLATPKNGHQLLKEIFDILPEGRLSEDTFYKIAV